MASKSAKYEMDMVNGPLLGKIITFSLPLMFSGILQLLYNAADVIVVGQFAGPTALAAVSSTGSLVNLIINLFTGLSLGASVLVAQEKGAGKSQEVSRTVHTAVGIAIASGIFLMFIGYFFSHGMLELMASP